jgi:hypothetical protein
MTDLVRCRCSRLNNAWRSYCGACGSQLEPRCDCGFVNGIGDRFCGGCGIAMVSQMRPVTQRIKISNMNENTIPLDIIKDALSGEVL